MPSNSAGILDTYSAEDLDYADFQMRKWKAWSEKRKRERLGLKALPEDRIYRDDGHRKNEQVLGDVKCIDCGYDMKRTAASIRASRKAHGGSMCDLCRRAKQRAATQKWNAEDVERRRWQTVS